MTKILTTNDLTTLLTFKGYASGIIYDVDPNANRWGANRLRFYKFSDDYNKVCLYVYSANGAMVEVVNYRKLKAADKAEMIKFIEGLPDDNNYHGGNYCVWKFAPGTEKPRVYRYNATKSEGDKIVKEFRENYDITYYCTLQEKDTRGENMPMPLQSEVQAILKNIHSL